MRLDHFLVATIAAVGLNQAALAQVPDQVSMCVTTAIGTCGELCQPFDCQPNYTLVSSNETMRFDVAGAPSTPYVLFFGVAVPGCLTVPGIVGQMATWTPAATITIGILPEAADSSLECLAARSSYYLPVPVIPAGIDFRYQLLGVHRTDAAAILSFSTPTEVRTR